MIDPTCLIWHHTIATARAVLLSWLFLNGSMHSSTAFYSINKNSKKRTFSILFHLLGMPL